MNSQFVLSQIFIYPVKSLGAITLQKAVIEERGLQHDRRWLVIDAHNRFLSQREFPAMALIEVALGENELILQHRTQSIAPLSVPFMPQTFDLLRVTVWDDTIEAIVVSDACNAWLSTVLGAPVRLVYLPDTSPRPADTAYAHFNTNVSFSDGFPYLVVSQSSLDDLNARLFEPVEILRFRPNLVVDGPPPYDEDQWFEFEIGQRQFYGVKPCARCIMTTINPQRGEFSGKEPLKTLAAYRKVNNKIFFGQNVITRTTGLLQVGDSVRVMSRKTRQTFSSI